MTILFQRLVEYAWIFYVACGIGIIVYVVRMLTARRERDLSMFTLERETATVGIARAWMMILVFVVIGVFVFASTTFVLPNMPFYSAEVPPLTPTLVAGVEPFTPTPTLTFTSTLTPTSSLTTELPVLTPGPLTTTEPVPTIPTPEVTETPAVTPTNTPEAVVTSGDTYVRFSNFAALVSYSLSAAEVTTAQPLLLTLYWQALEGASPADCMVFTHLLSEDGRLIAQHDGTPAGGTRPTTGWVAGETVIDLHAMAFQDAAYIGPARIAIGLYDSSSGRILTETGSDYVFLPITINIIPQ